MTTRFPIAVKNLSSVVTDTEVRHALPRFQKQVSRDFAPAYSSAAELQFYGRDVAIPTGAWLLGIFDTSDEAGALGYHDLTPTGEPLGKVFAKTSLEDGGYWTVTFSHELLEMIADPYINLLAADEAHQRIYAYEACDAVEADDLGYQIDDVWVSDFVLPNFWEPTHVARGERFAFNSKVPGPMRLMPGGYLSFIDLRTGRWNQDSARHGALARHLSRPQVGSRRERRRSGRENWIASTAG